jgi:hypothetical protein
MEKVPIDLIDAELASDDSKRIWAAAADATEYVFNLADARAIWPLALRYGSSADKDVRQAVATNILEHVLEHHFDEFFIELEREIESGNNLLLNTLRMSWQLGEAEKTHNSQKWKSLLKRHPGKRISE